jgi:hypothetical protein
VSPRTRLSPFPAPETLVVVVVVPLPHAKLRCGTGRHRCWQPCIPARACHQILGVYLGSDGLTIIKPDLILAVRWGSGRSDSLPHPRPAAGPGRLGRLTPRPLTPLAHLSARARALRSNRGHLSAIRWIRLHRTPLCGSFVKETLGFLKINASSLVFARRPLRFCRKAPDLFNLSQN